MQLDFTMEELALMRDATERVVTRYGELASRERDCLLAKVAQLESHLKIVKARLDEIEGREPEPLAIRRFRETEDVKQAADPAQIV